MSDKTPSGKLPPELEQIAMEIAEERADVFIPAIDAALPGLQAEAERLLAEARAMGEEPEPGSITVKADVPTCFGPVGIAVSVP